MTLKTFIAGCCLCLMPTLLPAQEAKPTEHVLGTITAVDPAAHTITVKDDKSGVETVLSVANTHTLLKVMPGAKDLKQAVRITADDLAVGDRVDARGSKSDPAASTTEARSVVLMSARDLAQKHQSEALAWQNSTAATVSAVDASLQTITATQRSAQGPRTFTIHVSPATQFTRYSPSDPKAPSSSQLADIQTGDQVRVIGQKDESGDNIQAQQIYSAPVRTVIATVINVSADGKQIAAKNLQTKQPVTIDLNDDSAVRKLSPEMAGMLARRFNPGARASAAGAGASPAPTQSQPGGEQAHPQEAGANAAPGGQRRGGDLSRMLERVPTITVTDLKPGDAVVVWGMAGQNPSTVTAHIVLAGVEPVLQSNSGRQGQSLNADWNLDMSVPAQ